MDWVFLYEEEEVEEHIDLKLETVRGTRWP